MSTPPPATTTPDTKPTKSPLVSPPPKRLKTDPTAEIDGVLSTGHASTNNNAQTAIEVALHTSTVPLGPAIQPLLSTPRKEQEEATAMATSSMSIPALQIKKLAPEARLPTRGSAFAAGYDLYASRNSVVPARGKVLVETDISIAVPAGTYGRIAPRSGLASKHFIDTGAGVIDADYRGPVKVLLFNHAETDFSIVAGDRIAQLVLERIVTPEVVEVTELEESVRGSGGFGSTGTN